MIEFVFLGALLGQLELGDKDRAPSRAQIVPAWQPAAEPYEILRSDAAWCGPRVLYFLALYLGEDCTLDQVVSLCRSDAEGNTTLFNLVEAAQRLNLEPMTIECSVEELLSLGGPAIICIDSRYPLAKGGAAPEQAPVHFVGLIARRSDDYLVLDPSFSMEPYGIDGKTITRRFTGQALLLKGCPRPSMRPVWLSFPLVLVSAGVIGTLLFTLAVWRWRKGSSLREVGSPCSEHPSG